MNSPSPDGINRRMTVQFPPKLKNRPIKDSLKKLNQTMKIKTTGPFNKPAASSEYDPDGSPTSRRSKSPRKSLYDTSHDGHDDGVARNRSQFMKSLFSSRTGMSPMKNTKHPLDL